MQFYSKSCSFVAGVALAASVASAGTITWGTPFELVSDADIDLTYPVVYALNAGDTTNNARILTGTAPASPLVATIGGKSVSFDGVEGKYGLDSAFGQLGFVFESFGDATSNLAGGSENVTFGVSTPRTVPLPQVSVDKDPTSLASEGRIYSTSTGNAELDTILNSQVFFDGRSVGFSALNISLNNLSPGQQYQVQIVAAADSRPASSSVPSVVTLNDGGGNSVAGLSGFADLDGDTILHVTSVLGTFTADGTSQPINAVLQAQRNGGVSAIIVTAIPEPASLAGLALSASFLTRRRR